MNVPFLDPSRFARLHAETLEHLLRDVLHSGRYVLGSQLAALEAELQDYLEVPHVVGVGSGTDALQLALLAAGIQCGDEVITTPFTFAATVEAILYIGAVPVLVDVDGRSWNIDVDEIEAAIGPRTRAVLPVHLFGQPADMEALGDLARRHELVIVEDAAQSLGARLGNRHGGTFGDFGAFSFYPSKTLGGLGDAGMVCCHDGKARERLEQLRNHGLDKGGTHQRLGFNSRLDELQAAVLRFKLALLDDSIARRRAIARAYDEVLERHGVRRQTPLAGADHAMGYYTLWIEDRDRLRSALAERGVASALYYGRPVHAHPAFQALCKAGGLPRAEEACAGCLSLPMFAELTDAEIEFVCAQLDELLSAGAAG